MKALKEQEDMYSMATCLDACLAIGVDVDSDLYVYVMFRFEKKELRKAFMQMKPPSHRVKWLMMTYKSWKASGKPLVL